MKIQYHRVTRNENGQIISVDGWKKEINIEPEKVDMKNTLYDDLYKGKGLSLKNATREFKIVMWIAIFLYIIIFSASLTLLDYRSENDTEKEVVQDIINVILVLLPVISTYFLDVLYQLASFKPNANKKEIMIRESESSFLRYVSSSYLVIFLVTVIYNIVQSDGTEKMKSILLIIVALSFLIPILGLAIYPIIAYFRKKQRRNKEI